MNPLFQTDAYGRNRSILKRWRLVGLGLGAAGLIAAVLAYQNPTTGNDDEIIGYETMGGVSYPITMSSSKRVQGGRALIGGKSMEVVADFKEWLGSLWHGKRLAYTLVVMASGSCAVCFYLGDFLSYPVPAPTRPGSSGTARTK